MSVLDPDMIHMYYENIMNRIYEQREEILEAFIAKYGCGPEDLVQKIEHTTNGTNWWVEKRTMKDQKIEDYYNDQYLSKYKGN